jgi:hypothetical protein
VFDPEVQGAKRLYWYFLQDQLLDECSVDTTKFWKSIGKIGVNCFKSNTIPMEVLLNDCSVSSRVDDVLARWETDLSTFILLLKLHTQKYFLQ